MSSRCAADGAAPAFGGCASNAKIKPLPAGMTLKFVDPAKLLDENDKWEKLYKDIITNQGR